MEIRRFGPGHRRPDGPPGTKGVTGQVLHNDARGVVSELAFGRYAVITPHSNPNTTLFVVISGGGFVQVGEERARVNHGEAVVWPAGVPHGAYTDGAEMRAIVIELPDREGGPLVLEGYARNELPAGSGAAAGEPAADARAADTDPSRMPGGATRAEGRLADREIRADEHDESEGEPW